MRGKIVDYDVNGIPVYELAPIESCVDGGSGPPSIGPIIGVGAGGAATGYASGTGGKSAGAGSVRGRIARGFRKAAKAIQCFNSTADRNFATTEAFIRQEVTVSLYDLGEITFEPGPMLLVTGSFLANSQTINGAVETAYRGAPSVGRNGAVLRGARHLGNVGYKFARGVAGVQASFTVGLAIGSVLVAGVHCL